MNDAKFKSSLSSKLEFWSDYCSLLVPDWHDLPCLLNSFLCPIFGIRKYKIVSRILVRLQKGNVARVKWPLFDRLRQIMQISKPVKFSCRPGTGSQQYSTRNSSFELRLDLKFPLFIQGTDYWNYHWNQICNNKFINPLVRGTLHLFWL